MSSKDKSEDATTKQAIKKQEQGVYVCEQGPDLAEKMFKLLFRATQNAHQAQTLLFKINQITHEYCFDTESTEADNTEFSEVNYEQQIKLVLESSLGHEILGSSEGEHLRECRLAVIELMARSHALVKRGRGIKDFN